MYIHKEKYQNKRVKSACFSCLFKVGFSHLMCIASFNISCSLLGAQSTMEKHLLLAKHWHAWDYFKCWSIYVWIPVPAQMLMNACQETSVSLANVTGITSCTRKLVVFFSSLLSVQWFISRPNIFRQWC